MWRGIVIFPPIGVHKLLNLFFPSLLPYRWSLLAWLAAFRIRIILMRIRIRIRGSASVMMDPDPDSDTDPDPDPR